MWRHLSIVVVALKTVVQSVRSNRWRFNFERGGRGGQINFLWKMAMINTITKVSILIICPFPRGLLLTYLISPPPIYSIVWGDNVIVCDNVTSSHLICNGTPGPVVHPLSMMAMPRISIVPLPVCYVLCSFLFKLDLYHNHSSSSAVLATCTELHWGDWYDVQHDDFSIWIELWIKEVENNAGSDKATLMPYISPF